MTTFGKRPKSKPSRLEKIALCIHDYKRERDISKIGTYPKGL